MYKEDESMDRIACSHFRDNSSPFDIHRAYLQNRGNWTYNTSKLK